MRFAAAACLALLTALPAVAEDCTDRARDLVAHEFLGGQPHIARIRTVWNGVETQSVFRWKSFNHHMTEAILPEGSPDSMYHDGVYYGSDGSGGWAEFNRPDPDVARAQADEIRQTLAANLTSADCVQITHGGAPYTAMTAQVSAFPPYESDLVSIYFIDEAGDVRAIRQSYMMAGHDMMMEQTLDPAPGLDLPLP